MKKSIVCGGALFLVVTAVCVCFIHHEPQALGRDLADLAKPEILPAWPSGEYSIKLTDGTVIQTSKGIHVFNFKGVTLMSTTTGYPQKPETVFFNPDHVVLIKSVGK